MRFAVVFLAVLLIATGPALAEDIRLEAENLLDSHNLGGTPIITKSCSAASGGLAMDGLDLDGEWLEFQLTVQEPLPFLVSVRSAGSTNLVRHFRVLFFAVDPESSEIQDEVSTGPGSGFG